MNDKPSHKSIGEKRVSEISKDTRAQLRFEFYKSVLTYELATLGGEITLLHTLFKTADGKIVAYISMVSIVLACFCMIGVKESFIKRIDPFPAENWLLSLIDYIDIGSPVTERLLSGLSGCFFGGGLLLFVIFVIQGL